MKNNIISGPRLWLWIVLFGGISFSCTKFDTATYFGANNVFTNKFYMNRDGKPVVPEAREIPVRFHIRDTVLTIYAEDKDNFALVIRINHFQGPGTYHFRTYTDSTFFYDNTIRMDDMEQNSMLHSIDGFPAQLRILEYDPSEEHQKITGTFDFVLGNDSLQTHLTDGYFFWTVITPY